MANNKTPLKEELLKAAPGIPILIVNILAILLGLALTVIGGLWCGGGQLALGVTGIVVGSLLLAICPVIFAGFKSVRPNEAIVFTLFGKYYGTLKSAGFFFVNPFVSAVAPPPSAAVMAGNNVASDINNAGKAGTAGGRSGPSNKMSLKALTLNNARQKINDKLGNPVEVGIVVIWRVVNTVDAMFNVDDYVEYLSIQCDSALRSIVRLYPYDTTDEEEASTGSLRGSSEEICSVLRGEIQSKVTIAGLEILEARITHLAYAPEIAAAMLQRQQASAIVDARQLIVDGAVGMVEMALAKLREHGVVELDEERKAAMVSNLMVVLCGNRDAQPVVNSGSLY